MVSDTVVTTREALLHDIFTQYDTQLRTPGVSMSVIIIKEIEEAQ